MRFEPNRLALVPVDDDPRHLLLTSEIAAAYDYMSCWQRLGNELFGGIAKATRSIRTKLIKDILKRVAPTHPYLVIHTDKPPKRTYTIDLRGQQEELLKAFHKLHQIDHVNFEYTALRVAGYKELIAQGGIPSLSREISLQKDRRGKFTAPCEPGVMLTTPLTISDLEDELNTGLVLQRNQKTLLDNYEIVSQVADKWLARCDISDELREKVMALMKKLAQEKVVQSTKPKHG